MFAWARSTSRSSFYATRDTITPAIVGTLMTASTFRFTGGSRITCNIVFGFCQLARHHRYTVVFSSC